MVTFENYDRKIEKINGVLAQYGIQDLDDAMAICQERASTLMTLPRKFSQSASKTFAGLM